MNGQRKIDGKNAVLTINDNRIKISYKNAFGELLGLNKIAFFTFDDIDEVEYKKPGITMNGFILIVLKNSDMHKIVLNKLDEYSLEITDEFVKELEERLGLEEESPVKRLDEREAYITVDDNIPSLKPEEIKPVVAVEEKGKDEKEKTVEEKKPIYVISNNPTAIFPPKKKEELSGEKKKDAINVTEKAIKIAAVSPIALVKPKSKKDLEIDKLREEIIAKAEEKRKELEELKKQEKKPVTIQGNYIVDKDVEIPSIPTRPRVFIREEVKDKPTDKMTVKRIVTKNNSPKEEKEDPVKVTEEQVIATAPPKEIKIEEKEKEKLKSKDLPLPSFLNKINLHTKKDKKKTEEFSKENEKTIRVGEISVDSKGKEHSPVPINASVRPLKKEELEELEKKKNDVIIDELKYKLYVIESELNELTFTLLILKKYVDTTYDQEKIKLLIKQIEDLVKVLEAIKQELINKMNGKDYVANKALDVTGDDIVNIDDFKTIYVKAIDRINEFEAELNTIKEKTNERKKEIEITDKEFENDSKKLKEKQELISKYDDFIARTRTYTEVLKYHVGKDSISTTEYYIKNVKEIGKDTKLLATLSAVSLANPTINGPTTAIVTTATGLAAMRDAIIPKDSVKVTKETITPIDYSREIRMSIRDVNDASQYITRARKDITDIKKEINDKYKNYPEYKELLEEFDKLEVEIDRQEKVLNTVIYTLTGEYITNRNQKILVLEKEDEN